MISAKEKAIELIDKMYFSRRYKEGEDYIPEQAQIHAKQCASIAVDEILSMGIMAESGDWNMTKEFWQEVKNEINKL